MTYSFFRWIAGIMLHWFYSDIQVVGAERIPSDGGLLIAVNHPNAMVDALIGAWVMPRRVTLTAKATLMSNAIVAFLFNRIGLVPLRRSSDEGSGAAAAPNPERNQGAFREIIGVLRAGGAVLIFPEGITHSNPELAPLKTGLARIALRAREEGVRNLSILPVGLSFEEKGEPGTRVLAKVGQVISVDSWPGTDPHELTASLSEKLREVSLINQYRPVPALPPHRSPLVRIASWWGKTAHEIPVRLARRIAVARSENPDQPAMFTMLIGLGLILIFYVLHLTVVGLITRSFPITALYLAALIWGAYWTAYNGHRPPP
jgi:1-acyl-sn-glycerol-3-phosphate acyltransferase